MTLNVNSLLCRQCYVYCDETARIESRVFRYEVAHTIAQVYAY